MSKLSKLLAMQPTDRALLLQATSFLLICRIGLYLLSFERLQRWATRSNKNQRSAPLSRLIWAAKTSARLIPNSTCLARALAATKLLAQNGYESTLHIGVRLTEGVFEAHAWVEYDGCAIIGSEEASEYARLCSWESERPFEPAHFAKTDYRPHKPVV
jgi:hypothetical protein